MDRRGSTPTARMLWRGRGVPRAVTRPVWGAEAREWAPQPGDPLEEVCPEIAPPARPRLDSRVGATCVPLLRHPDDRGLEGRPGTPRGGGGHEQPRGQAGPPGPAPGGRPGPPP